MTFPLTRSRSRARFFGTPFSPVSLFANGEQGAWYDPSDLTTLFQDAAGTTPTTMETRARLMLDKSKGLVLGSELFVNPNCTDLTGFTTGGTNPPTLTFDNGVKGTVTIDDAPGRIQTTTITGLVVGKTYLVTVTANNACTKGNFVASAWTWGTIADTNFALGVSTRTFRVTATATSGVCRYYLGNQADNDGNVATITQHSIKELAGNHAVAPSDASSPILRARYNLLLNSATLSTQSVTTVATGYVLRFEGAGSIALSGTASGTLTAGSHTITCTAGTLTLTVTGTVTSADLRTSADAALNIPAYQSITTATSYDTNGFPPYLAFDGTDDSFSTASIDFTGTPQMTVFAGVTKLSDAAQGVVVELSAAIASNNGAFLLAAPDGATQTFGWDSKGTLQVDAVATSQAAPRNAVLTGIGDIGADICTIRVNGAQADTDTGDQGSGNYANAAVFIGRTNNTSSPLNGRIYSLIIRGASTTTPLIASTEQWVAGKMRLPI